MTRWFRLYDDVINEPKLLKLPEALRWAWVALLCVASKNGGRLPPIDDVALLLRVPEPKAAEYITKLVKAKLIDNLDGAFVPHNWEGRQFKSDSSNERVKRHRESKRNVTSETECNVTSGVTSSVTETPPEAEAESKADSEQSRADAGAPIDEDLKRRAQVIGAGISAHFLGRQLPIPNLERCLHWLTQGYAQGTILAAVEAVLKRPGAKPATLEYFDGAIRDAHARTIPTTSPIEVTNKIFVEVGTPEWAAWHHHSRSAGGRGFPITQHRVGESLRDGFWFSKRVPDGYDEATGEKLEAAGEERVA